MRLRIFTISLMLSTATLLSGCGSTGPLYRAHRDIAPGGSQIVIFRGDSFFQGGIPYLVKINGKESAILRNGGYSVVGVVPGTSTIEIRAANWMQALFRNPTISVTTAANERIFVRATPELGNTASLSLVPAEFATLQLQSLSESQ